MGPHAGYCTIFRVFIKGDVVSVTEKGWLLVISVTEKGWVVVSVTEKGWLLVVSGTEKGWVVVLFRFLAVQCTVNVW